MNQQDHEIFMQHLAATDQRPKNEGSSPRSNGKLPYVYRERTRLYGATEEMFNELNEEMGNPKEWWYNPYKHHKLLLDIFHKSMLSGYEVDITPFIGGRQGETCYKVYTGSEFIKMNAEDYHRLWNEAVDSYEDWINFIYDPLGRQGTISTSQNARCYKDMERKRLASAEQDVLLIDRKLVNAYSDVTADKEFNVLCSDGVVRSCKWNFNYKEIK